MKRLSSLIPKIVNFIHVEKCKCCFYFCFFQNQFYISILLYLWLTPIKPLNIMTAFVEKHMLKAFVLMPHHLSLKTIFLLPHTLFEDSYHKTSIMEKKKCTLHNNFIEMSMQ